MRKNSIVYKMIKMKVVIIGDLYFVQFCVNHSLEASLDREEKSIIFFADVEQL